MFSLKSVPILAAIAISAIGQAQEDENPVLKLKGKRMPAISMTTTQGVKIKSANLKGKVTLIDFWASWCVPCFQMSKVMEDLHAAYPAKQVVVIGADVQEQSPRDLQRSLRTHPKKYTVTVKNDDLCQRIGVAGLPTVLVVDKHGIVREVYTGYGSDTKATVEKLVASLVAEK